MSSYKGKYPYSAGHNRPVLKSGVLFTYPEYESLEDHGWDASFKFDEKEVPGKVTAGVVGMIDIYELHLKTEKQTYELALKRGFVPTKEKK